MGALLTSPEVVNNKNWAKCNLAADYHLRENLVEILHNRNNAFGNYSGLPEDPTALYNFFVQHKGQIKKRSSKSKKGDLLVFDDQFDLLLPANQQTHISQMDITLIGSIIKYFLKEHPFGVVINDALDLRNKLKHGILDDLKTEKQANTKLQEIRSCLVKMSYGHLHRFDKMIKDDEFILPIGEANNYLSTVVAQLQKDLTNKIDHEKKLLYDFLIKELKTRLEGMIVNALCHYSFFLLD